MNGKLNNEQLSALLDSELTAEERTALEQQLAQSPELQQELAELRRVSVSLRALRQIPAPASLHASIMAEIQQNVRPGTDRPAGSGRAGGRPGLTRLVGLSAAIAVAVGAAVWFGQDRDQQIAENGNAAQPIVSVQQDRPEALANRAEFRGAPDSSTDAITGNDDALHVETHQRVLQISRDDLTAARVGDIIEAVDANGDSVAVIRLTVVDRKQGVEALQVLLTSQQFESVDGSETAGAEQGGLVAVYVESDREKLSQAISEFRSQLDFGSLEVASPVRVAELEPETRTELGIDDEADSATASQRAVALKPGSQLDRLAQPAATAAGSSDSASAATASSDGNATDKPVRVIFVVVDGPTSDATNKVAPKENGAA